MSIYRVPKDLPPCGLSFETMVLGNSAYATGSFNAYIDTSREYSTWFTESFAGQIIGDVPVSGGSRWPLRQSGKRVQRLQRPR